MQASRVIRSVRDASTEYLVTVRGKPVARLRQLAHGETQQSHELPTEQRIQELKSLAAEISTAWKSDESAVELVAAPRR